MLNISIGHGGVRIWIFNLTYQIAIRQYRDKFNTTAESVKLHPMSIRLIDRRNLGLMLLLALLPVGCVQREMIVVSNPPGAVVYLNDREMGRTPFKKEFLWYGNYDVVLRKDGYQTLKTSAEITAPFWQFVPFDLVTDFLPLRDEETISFSLKPDVPTDPRLLVQRGEQMQAELESSEHTVHRAALEVHPTTRPTTEPDWRGPD